MKTDVPTNCWLSPQGEAHKVEHTKHTSAAREIAAQQAVSRVPDESGPLYALLYNLGWVRVQWEGPTRVNVAFHTLTEPARERVEELIDFLLCSEVSVYVVAPGDSDFFQPGDRHWKAKLWSLNAVPEHWGAGEGFGNPHA